MKTTLITKRENVRYLTGFDGSFGFVIMENDTPKYLTTDARYIERAKQCIKGSLTDVILWNKEGQETIKKQLENETEIQIEDSITLAQLERWKKFLPGAKFISKKNSIEELRSIKTEEEIEKIRTAAAHVDSILSDVNGMKTILHEGVTEREAAFLLEQLIQDRGRFGIAFPTIIAFGENSAIPHHEPGPRVLKKGDNILIDCGAIFEGFHSDITRNYFLEEPGKSFREAFTLLRLAQKSTLKQFKPGLEIQKTASFCRNLLGEEKEFFTHSLGHGVGLEIHELPNIRATQVRTSNTSDPLNLNFKIGQVVTCEPGLYYPGKFGIRIEDIVVIMQNGPEILTKTRKDLILLS